MTPGWHNVRNNLAETYARPRWDLWRSWKFYAHVAVSVAIWFLLAVVIFR
jgi:hypothetical protein